MKYKSTLNLPFTNFSMKGNLIKKENDIICKWFYKNNLYNEIRLCRKNEKVFFLHDGPPYANGNIHIGHALNKILKDIIIKFKVLSGYDSPYIPGWDCHGLPIEIEVKKKNNIKNGYKFRKLCRDYALSQINNQKKDFIRLGIIADWDNFYLTMNPKIVSNVIRLFGDIINNNFLYSENKSMLWCFDCVSVVSENETKYLKVKSPSVYIKFLLNNKVDFLKKNKIDYEFIKNVYILVWTTNPWTLPSNSAISVNPDFYYSFVLFMNDIYILKDDLVESVMKKSNIFNYIVLIKLKGLLLNNVVFINPLVDLNISVVLNKYIKDKIGTGVVYISPSHGKNDYIIGKIYNLTIANLVDKYGIFKYKNFSVLNGMNIFECNKMVINFLFKKNSIFVLRSINHFVLYCIRHNKLTIYRSTKQWFLKINDIFFKNKFVKLLDKIEFIPKSSKLHIKNMIYNRSDDWCISRQRKWGIPICLFVNKNNGLIHKNSFDFIKIIANNIEVYGVEYWWNLDKKKFLNYDCEDYYKCNDVFDVWFESGSTYFSVLSIYSDINKKINNSSDLYLEGVDQFRGWFMSSLLISIMSNNILPCKKILSHGFVINSYNEKMSKSKCNYISPNYILNKYGCDILRLLISSFNYKKNVYFSDESLNITINIYRKIRNSIKFILGNLNDFNPVTCIVNNSDMVFIDLWIINYMNKIQKKIIFFYKKYFFYKIIQVIIKFCSLILSSFYFEIIKDRLYTNKYNSISRRSCQTALYYIIESLVRLLCPIMSFTCDEIWNYIPGFRSKYVFTEKFYDKLFSFKYLKGNFFLLKEYYWKILINLKKKVNKIIEFNIKNKYINNSLELNIKLYVNNIFYKKMLILKDELNFFLLVSKVLIIKKNNDYFNNKDDNIFIYKNIKFLILLKKSNKKKCFRCWNYVLYKSNFNNLCNRCLNNIYNLGENRKYF